jgi:hypothetical protein
MRRYVIATLVVLLLAGASLFIPDVRSHIRALVRPDPPPRITPIALSGPPSPAPRPTPPRPTRTPQPATLPAATPTGAPVAATPAPTAEPSPSPTPAPVVVDGRVYDAYIPAASKEHQAYKFSCEFDAAWVILRTYGFEASVDELIAAVGVDRSVEPYIQQTKEGFLIHGGDITRSFSGDYKTNFLARSSGEAMRKAFERYRLRVLPVHDRAGVEAALRSGALVWIKTTVDFNVWRPATWVMPDGRTRQTVLGNDHAVVVMGFNATGVVIRDVLGPTSSNWRRPYEYEVDWDTFLAAWAAQEFDGLAVSPP